jgi:hypothetical protein
MMMNPASLEAESAVVRAYTPRQGRSMLRGELQEQARIANAARARKRDQRNAQSSAVFEAGALGGDGVEVPAALGVVTSTLRKMAKYREDCITALEHSFRQRRASTRCCKVCSGLTPEDSVVEASGLAVLLARLEKESWSVSPTLVSGPNDWSLAGIEWPPGKIAHAVGEAALVDEPRTSKVRRGAAELKSPSKTKSMALYLRTPGAR